MSHFETVLRLDPEHAYARLDLGNTFLMMGNKEEAVTQYRKALAIKPNFLDAHKNLGLVLASKGEMEEAGYHFEAVLRANPDDKMARTLLSAGGRTTQP